MKIITCGTCKKEKIVEEFSVYNDKISKSCKQCRKYYNDLWKINKDNYKDKRKQYYRENKEKHRFRNFKNSIYKKYGVTIEIYEKMLKDQLNRCAICGIEFILNGLKSNLNKLPCIDHCHQTNKVRGLLCRMCNITLGHIESGLYDKSIEYLRVNEVKIKNLMK